MLRAMSTGGRLRGVAIPVAISLVLLGLLEGGCRLAGRVRKGSWPKTRAEEYLATSRAIGQAFQLHPYLVMTSRPGAAVRIPGHELTFNLQGYRGHPVPVPKPNGVYRVLFAGGSTTLDLLASDDATAWPALVGGRLAAKGVDVVNAGLPGYTTVESLIALELRDVDLRPDLVVLFSGVNDVQPASHRPFAPDYSLGHGELLARHIGVEPMRAGVLSRSLFLESLMDALQPARGREVRYAPAFGWRGGERRAAIAPEAAAVYERNLRSFVAVAAAHGARTLLVSQQIHMRAGTRASDCAYVESWAPGLTCDGYVKAVEQYAEVARRIAGEGLAAYLDPFAGGAFGDEDFGDAFHFSAAGSARFAELVAATISRDLPAR